MTLRVEVVALTACTSPRVITKQEVRGSVVAHIYIDNNQSL